jgi:phospholipase C
MVQENHSFDNYFGTYPTANGTLVNNITSRLAPVNGIPNHVCLAYSGSCISPHLSTDPRPENPVEGQKVYENDYGPTSNFATSSGPQSMVYFDYHTVAGYWNYAEEYGLADNYYSAVLSMTTPNRLMMLTGDSSVSENYGPPPFVEFNATVFGQLATAGVSWGYYDLIGSLTEPSAVFPLNYIAGFRTSGGEVKNVTSFLNELRTGQGLPSVSFVNFLGGLTLSEHPPFSPPEGEAQVINLVNAIMSSSYWNSTAVFITWDEGGGFYDHVQPPRSFTLDQGFSRPLLGLGQRVPLLVISPYSRTNYVSHVLLSHLSLLHLIEYNWNLPALNAVVGGSNLPLDFFDFSQTPRLSLPAGLRSNIAQSYPLPLQSTSASEGSPVDTSFVSNSGLVAASVGVAGTILFSWHKSRTNRPRPNAERP